MSKKNPKRLLNMLSSEQFKSGEEIGKTLGISRAAVAKQIKSLQELGVDIFSVHGKGYRLNDAIPLYNTDQLRASLVNPKQNLLVIEDVIESTNDFIKANIKNLGDGFICLAEGQTKGRGRQGKDWFSPFGASIYLSMKWGFAQGYQSLSGLSLAVGVTLLRVVKSVGGTNVSLKWPNDVYVDSKKIAGILIEISGNGDGSCDAIIGVGLNVNIPIDNKIDQPWIDLNSVSEHQVDKSDVAARLINALRAALDTFSRTGLSTFKQDWQEHDHFLNEIVCLDVGQNKIRGTAKGISATGALLLEIEEQGVKVIKEFSGGEISVRKW